MPRQRGYNDAYNSKAGYPSQACLFAAISRRRRSRPGRSPLAAIDRWAKEVAPSTELRRWFGHDPSRWEEFRRRYKAELSHNAALMNELRAIAQKGHLTLVYAARDEVHNEAVMLRDVLIH